MKIGVIAQRFGLPLFEAIQKAAELRFDGVQLYAESPRERLVDFSPEKRREVVKFCLDLNLEIEAVCGELGGYGFRLKAEHPAKIERTRRNLDLALDLGCNIVSCHIGRIREDVDDELRRNQLAALSEINEYAKKSGAFLAIETGPETGEGLKNFLLELDGSNIKVNLDAGNMVMITGENPSVTALSLAPYIIHTHAKDGMKFAKCSPEKVYAAFAEGGIKQLFAENGRLFTEMPIGAGFINWDEYLNTLRSINYDGYLTIEREISESTIADCANALKFLRSKI